MNLHQEIHFETEICEHLANHGWLYAEDATVRDGIKNILLNHAGLWESLREESDS